MASTERYDRAFQLALSLEATCHEQGIPEAEYTKWAAMAFESLRDRTNVSWEDYDAAISSMMELVRRAIS